MTRPDDPSPRELPGLRGDRQETSAALIEDRLRRAEDALGRNEELLRAALAVGGLGTWQRDLRTGEVTLSARCRSDLGLSPDAPVTFKDIRSMWHPDDADRVMQTFLEAIASRTDYDLRYRVVRPDGTVGCILARGHAVYEGDEPVHIVGVTLDITEQERARAAIENAERRRAFLLELSDRLGTLEDPEAIAGAGLEALGRFFGADCVGYAGIDPTRPSPIAGREWRPPSAEKPLPPCLELMDPEIAEIKGGQPVWIRRTGDEKPRTAFAIPLMDEGSLAAVFYVEQDAARPWTKDDLALIEDATQRVWGFIDQAATEAVLRESEARFRTLADALPALVWIVDAELKLVYANARWRAFSGLPPELALGYSWKDSVHPDDVAAIEAQVVSMQGNETAFGFEMRYRTVEGVYRWHMIQAEPVRNVRGELTAWYGASVDIHDRKLAEAALRESEERLALAQRAAGIGVFDWHVPSGRVTWTAEQERLFGMTPGTFEGTFEGWASRVLPDGLAATNANIAEAIARGEKETDFAYEARRPDGTIHSIEGSGMIFYAPDGTPQRIVGVNIDVTERKQADERQHLLIRELHHRVKNTLATVQAIVSSTARNASSIDDFYQGFVGRIISLAQTHDLLTDDYWQKASLEELLHNELGPYEDGDETRIFIQGPPVELPSEAAVPIGMAIHELTTNAAKHGALSTSEGDVRVAWTLEPADGESKMLHFSWTEHGGPPVVPPRRQGFGSRLLQRVLTAQLQAKVEIDYAVEGVRFSMVMPVPQSAALLNPLS